MIGVGLVSFCCIMFIHLGLGETINKIIHFDFVLFRCTKCLNFWAVLTYTFFIVELPILESCSLAFGLSYTALWIDLLLAKIAEKYDIWYEEIEKDMEGSDEQTDSGSGI